MGDVKRVLVIQLGPLEAFVQALPAMAAVRLAHRGVHIGLLTSASLAPFAADVPYCDEVYGEETLEDPRALARLAQSMKKDKWSLVYDFDNSDATERLFGSLKPFPPPWCGTVKGAKYRYDRDDEDYAHPTDVLMAQVRMAGGSATNAAIPDARWASTARSNAPSLKPAFFGMTQPYVMLAPAAQLEGGAPRWPTARYAGLAARLARAGVHVAVVSDPDDRAAARAVTQACPEAKDLTSRADLTQIAALASEAAGAFGHADTGVVHLLAAAGAPTIALAASHEEAARGGVRGEGVVTLATPDPDALTVEYAASTLGMFAGIDALKAQAAQA